jgi:ribonuclease E
MAKRMLIDAAHPEETRVVVTSGVRLEEFDFESSTKRQVKGNIYLAKVTRVEPSLQAAFIDYSGNRHGFLAFSEIHPDYYRIPVGDRRGGEPESFAAYERADTEDGGDDAGVPLSKALPEPVTVSEATAGDDEPAEDAPHRVDSEHDDAEGLEANAAVDLPADFPADLPAEFGWASSEDLAQPTVAESSEASPAETRFEEPPPEPATETKQWPAETAEPAVVSAPAETSSEPTAEAAAPTIGVVQPAEPAGEPQPPAAALHMPADPQLAAGISDMAEWSAEPSIAEPQETSGSDATDIAVADQLGEAATIDRTGDLVHIEAPSGDTSDEDAAQAGVETFGGDEVEEVEEADAERRRAYHPARHYKIQEVIKRRQIMLVQVAKEERGNKGAALTTYLSLAGRYCVLMPNTNRGGGVSRKITSIADRRRLKDILEELEIPEGMGVIVRTAGAERSKAEIRRDYEYLLRLWNEIRDLTLNSTAPALIYEEGNLIKRSIRDLYARDIDEVLVEGDEGYRTAKAFMRTLMPSHAKRVQPYRDPQIGLFHRFQIESQIDAIHSPIAQLRSGGYIVINQTEALVSIDVNSGRSTRERNIEETALRTNLEAADEIARQLRLRDLAGLIVIDFIDMEEHRNQIAVERRLKEALKNDRARIQVGRISPFGLLEMSRQRLRPSLAEASTQPCPHCGGTGFIRSVESTALYVLRSIEEEGIRRRSAEIAVYVPTNVALYILNQKREALTSIETRYDIKVTIGQDDALIPPNFRLERLRAHAAGEAPPLRVVQAPAVVVEEEDEAEEVEEAVHDPDETGETEAAAGDDERGRRRRRRRRRRDEPREARAGAGRSEETAAAQARGEANGEAEPEHEDEGDRRRRRRGRRGARPRPSHGETTNATANGIEAQVIDVMDGDEATNNAVEELPPLLETWPPEPAVETASLQQPSERDEWSSQQSTETSEAPEAEAEPPTAEAEPGIPFASETERTFEEVGMTPALYEMALPEEAAATEASAADDTMAEAMVGEAPLPARTADNVLTITEKPSNPRRGWWQRLIQQ